MYSIPSMYISAILPSAAFSLGPSFTSDVPSTSNPSWLSISPANCDAMYDLPFPYGPYLATSAGVISSLLTPSILATSVGVATASESILVAMIFLLATAIASATLASILPSDVNTSALAGSSFRRSDCGDVNSPGVPVGIAVFPICTSTSSNILTASLAILVVTLASSILATAILPSVVRALATGPSTLPKLNAGIVLFVSFSIHPLYSKFGNSLRSSVAISFSIPLSVAICFDSSINSFLDSYSASNCLLISPSLASSSTLSSCRLLNALSNLVISAFSLAIILANVFFSVLVVVFLALSSLASASLYLVFTESSSLSISANLFLIAILSVFSVAITSLVVFIPSLTIFMSALYWLSSSLIDSNLVCTSAILSLASTLASSLVSVAFSCLLPSVAILSAHLPVSTFFGSSFFILLSSTSLVSVPASINSSNVTTLLIA